MSKEIIRREVSDVLGKTQSTSSFNLSGQDNYYTTAVSGDEVNQQKALTGAMAAILPMRIVTLGQGNTRVEFTLLINPTSWNHGKTQTSQKVYTRKGWQVQLWGPNQDTISSSGKTAAFYTPSIGLDNFTKELSFGYLNFLSVISAYKMNGYQFMDRLDAQAKTRVIDKVSGVEIQFDNGTYYGHFNNFTLDEDDEHPYLLNYNFEFITSAFDEAEYEIRGHYLRIPAADDKSKDYPLNDSLLGLVDDVYEKELDFPVAAPRPVEDEVTGKLWEAKTGLPYSEVYSLGLTSGTVQDNLRLRQQLYTMTWNPKTKRFE